ncbi:MAG: aconitate hydratase, partial [Deltaproteobacteria bacterium]|nr:aconitate hydratase [Deltaproteobacteria bacterium]
GPGVSCLSVFDRATICNMGTETGATSSLFPSDHQTYRFLKSFGRNKDWMALKADENATYDDMVTINLSEIEPLVAMPHSPDRVKKVSEVEGISITQIAIGSCTNSSFKDLTIAAHILKGKTIHPDINLVVSPGSRRTLSGIAESGTLASLIHAGARVLENTCGPCNGIGQSPESGGHSLRTHNRNFKGRSGTQDAHVYLASAETAAASALFGCITDPRKMGSYPAISLPESFPAHPDMFIRPATEPERVTVSKGPNIKPIPLSTPLPYRMLSPVELKLGDHITTDHILPGGSHMLALRSNVPASVPYVFSRIDPEFAARADTLPEQWAVVAGENYGQGSSREHAVMVPMSIGMKLVIARSFARIYRRNLINFGVIPLVFQDPEDYHKIDKNDLLVLNDLEKQIEADTVKVFNKTKNFSFMTRGDFSFKEKVLIRNGGLLNYLKFKFSPVS